MLMPVLPVLLLIPAVCAWYYYFKKRDELNKKYTEAELHYEKLNCVVIYSKIHGMQGWPGFRNKPAKITYLNIRDAFAPLTYFFSDTKATLDIAIMSITSNIIVTALVSLIKEGVKVRLLLDYDHMAKGYALKELINAGGEVLIYVGTSNSSSIFHYKYAIKDYGSDSSALYCGSLNWSNPAFVENYENMVFTTNTEIIDKFYENYIKSVNTVKRLAEDNLYAKVKLKELYANMKVI